jgi:hypothetical protein
VLHVKWYSPSAIALIIANLLPLYGVLFWSGSVLALLVLFWLEIIVVGLLAVLRMLIASPSSDPPPLRNFAWMLGFCILYTVFVLGLGIAIFGFFGHLEGVMPFEGGLLPLDQTTRLLEKRGLWPALAALCASHAFSFLWNYVGRGEYRRARLKDLMWEANSRVYIMVFSLFFGSLFMQLGSPVWGLAILIGFKIWLDLGAHLRAHRAA